MSRRLIYWTALWISLLLLSTCSYAQSGKMECAYIYQFTKLITWRDDMVSGDFTIGILGSRSDVAVELERLHGRKVGTRPIRIGSFSSTKHITPTNILYVPRSLASELTAVRKRLKLSCTLIICGLEGAYEQGAHISFSAGRYRLDYELNKTEMEAVGHPLAPNSAAG